MNLLFLSARWLPSGFTSRKDLNRKDYVPNLSLWFVKPFPFGFLFGCGMVRRSHSKKKLKNRHSHSVGLLLSLFFF